MPVLSGSNPPLLFRIFSHSLVPWNAEMRALLMVGRHPNRNQGANDNAERIANASIFIGRGPIPTEHVTEQRRLSNCRRIN
jgi:hypothetical protein